MSIRIHIHRVPTKVILEEVGLPRWCFGCHKRLPGTFRLNDPIEQPSYYEPNWTYECDGCHEDRRLGFGWEWLDGVAGPTTADRAAAAPQETA